MQPQLPGLPAVPGRAWLHERLLHDLHRRLQAQRRGHLRAGEQRPGQVLPRRVIEVQQRRPRAAAPSAHLVRLDHRRPSTHPHAGQHVPRGLRHVQRQRVPVLRCGCAVQLAWAAASPACTCRPAAYPPASTLLGPPASPSVLVPCRLVQQRQRPLLPLRQCAQPGRLRHLQRVHGPRRPEPVVLPGVKRQGQVHGLHSALRARGRRHADVPLPDEQERIGLVACPARRRRGPTALGGGV